MRKSRAFTTLEMIIVLGLVALIMCMLGPQFGRSKQCMAEDRFWQSFRQEWRLAQTQAQLNHLPTTIFYDSTTNTLVFARDHHRRYVDLPSSLLVTSFTPVMMKTDGYVRPGTRCFYSQVRKCRYQLVVQMARGEFDVKKE